MKWDTRLVNGLVDRALQKVLRHVVHGADLAAARRDEHKNVKQGKRQENVQT